jgi:acetyl-CoA acetyltransferase
VSLTLLRNTRTSKGPDDVVITLAIRTPLCKGKKGGFKDTSLEYIMFGILQATRERMGFSPHLVEDICMGNVRYWNDS